MKYLKSYLESNTDQLYRQVSQDEFDEYFIGKKYINISPKEYEFIKNIFSNELFFIYLRNKFIEILFDSADGDDSQILIFKYDDEWWSIQIHISNGPSYYYISDTIDGISNIMKNEPQIYW